MMRRTAIARTRAVASNFLLHPEEGRPFGEALATHQRSGQDLASGLTSDFASMQVQLIKYRIVRLADEVVHLRNHPADGIPTMPKLALHVVLLFVFYQVGMLFGRLDTQPLERPPAAVSAA